MPEKQRCVGILRETCNVWERRVPISPDHVRILVSQGFRVLVQPSERRVFEAEEYEAAGAEVIENLADASVIFGVKGVDPASLLPSKTYVFFSHTGKAQKENMPLLDAVLDKKVCLVDYEFMEDAGGRRLVMFGRWAGRTGLINILNGLGVRLVALGYNTPFLYVSMAHNYRDLEEAETALKKVGADLSKRPLRPALTPFVVVFTGYGNVSQGAQEMMRLLPHEYVTVEDLPKLQDKGPCGDRVFLCVCGEKDHLVRLDDGEFSLDHFLANPHLYRSDFASKVAPYASVIVNGIMWQPMQPRLLTKRDMETLLRPSSAAPGLPHKLLAISDISADPDGSLEFMSRCTSIDKPFYIYRTSSNEITDSMDCGDGVLVSSVDNLPAQLAREAALDFSALLFPHIPDLMVAEEGSRVVSDAVIASGGRLRPRFEYIHQLRQKRN